MKSTTLLIGYVMTEKGKYVYEWPRPMVTVDAIVFNKLDGRWRVLMIQRANEPFVGKWAFPGGFIELDEELEDAVVRELAEETGLREIEFEQMYTFGKCGRDPRGRQITVTFIGIAPEGTVEVKGGDDAAMAMWFYIDELPEEFAFDHADIAKFAIRRLKDLMED